MAAGDLLADFSPQCNEPPSSDAATPDVRNGHPVLDFDDSSDEAAVFTGFMPWHYSGGGITAYAVVSFTSDCTSLWSISLILSLQNLHLLSRVYLGLLFLAIAAPLLLRLRSPQ